FHCFTLLSMQTADDQKRMIALGIAAEKVVHFGNLKYEMPGKPLLAIGFDQPVYQSGGQPIIWVCGSTHSGEEELLLAAFKELALDEGLKERLLLILAPRDISRGKELVQMAQDLGLEAGTRSKDIALDTTTKVIILDTLGELAACYSLARLAFIGGSLVPQGGHNPIEAAVRGVPILFGHHMEDFSEIAQDLIMCGGAKTVSTKKLARTASAILFQDDLHRTMAKAARTLVEEQQGGVQQHVQAIKHLLQKR
ncbi:MAG: hypothetical protein D3923_12745, partial [Candidatus Electrothrix sp. AR3]|nr:hypothetical protein [Candidatus Electrothrix sp. AR3]